MSNGGLTMPNLWNQWVQCAAYLGLNSDTADIERLTKLIQHFPMLEQALLLGGAVVSLFVTPLAAIAESITVEESASYRISTYHGQV